MRCYNIPTCQLLTAKHGLVQGLSFQIWPSSVSLAKYAEAQQLHQPGCWQVTNLTLTGMSAQLQSLDACCMH